MTTSPQATTFEHLRLAKAPLLANYLLHRPQLLHSWKWRKARRTNVEYSPTDAVVYHSWRPGFLRIPKMAGDIVRRLMSGEATIETSKNHGLVAQQLADLGWCEDEPIDFAALLDKMRDNFPAVQNPREVRPFLELVHEHRPRTVVEIGTAAGGLFYALSQVADPEAKMISIDIEGGLYGGGQSVNDTLVFSTFGPRQSFHFLRTRSFHLSTRQALEKALGGRQIDLLLIDGDHSYAGVKGDFEMYSPYVAPGGLIALHDICDFPAHFKQWREGNDVHAFWRELQAKGYETREIVDSGPADGPTDEVWETRWPAIGLGVIFWQD